MFFNKYMLVSSEGQKISKYMKFENLSRGKILDLSQEGEMTPQYARKFNKVADEIRQEYVFCLNELSEKYVHDLNWFVTPFACRNTYVCSVFEDVVKVIFSRQMLDEDKDICMIIVDTPTLAKVIASFAPKSVLIKSKQGKLKYYVSLLLKVLVSLFRYVISSLVRHTSFKLASLDPSYKNNRLDSEPYSVIETYVYKNSFGGGEFNDRHFNAVSTYLSENAARKLIYVPMFYRVRNYFTLYMRAFKSNSKFLFVEEHTSFLDILRSLQHPFLLDYAQSNVKIRGIDISLLVIHSLIRHSTHTSSLYAILKYRFCENLRKSNRLSIKRIVRWYENQEIDHGSIMGWRKYSETTPIIGYMDFFSSSNYLCAYPIPVELKQRMIPDCIGVMGGGLVSSHKRFCNALNIKVVPSFRFSTVSVSEEREAKTSDEVIILVTLPISRNHINIITKVIADFPSVNDGMPIQFAIKSHPASKFVLGEKLSTHNNVQYTLVDESLPTLLERADFVLSAASSTLVEAIMYGVPAILVSSTQSLRENVIPEVVPDKLWKEIFNARELYAAVNEYKKNDNKFASKELNNLNSKIVEMQADRSNVPNLFGSIDS